MSEKTITNIDSRGDHVLYDCAENIKKFLREVYNILDKTPLKPREVMSCISFINNRIKEITKIEIDDNDLEKIDKIQTGGKEKLGTDVREALCYFNALIEYINNSNNNSLVRNRALLINRIEHLKDKLLDRVGLKKVFLVKKTHL